MSRLPSRGRLKANAVACERLIHSPSTWNGNPVIPAMSERTKSAVILPISPLVHVGIDSSGGEYTGREIFNHSPIGESFATSAALSADQIPAFAWHPGILTKF